MIYETFINSSNWIKEDDVQPTENSDKAHDSSLCCLEKALSNAWFIWAQWIFSVTWIWFVKLSAGIRYLPENLGRILKILI